jgi:vacuolar-type H+-ATPase subunit H
MHARRYEMFREGIDDYRYISALREVAKRRGSAAVRKAEKLIQQAVDDVTSHVEDTTLCDKWRRRIAKEIIANLHS